jgi:hypothetical protein
LSSNPNNVKTNTSKNTSKIPLLQLKMGDDLLALYKEELRKWLKY